MEREGSDGFARVSAPHSGAGQAQDPSAYCPVCSKRLEARQCKLLCLQCGYYLSCSDYY